MAEYVSGEPMAVDVGDPITFENKTDDSFSVDVGIVFRKSGLYRVSVVGKHTSVEIEPERKKGKWQITNAYPHNVYCSECHKKFAQTHWAVWEDGTLPRNFCPNCGAKMEGGAE